jgi:two-component SAPR family response regulator
MDATDAAERRGRPTEALPLLVEACSLWRGDIAADLDHEWLELERIHVRGRFVRGACRAAELLVATGRPTEAVEVVRQAVEVDPWNDRGYEPLAAGYRAMGDITSARAVEARAAERAVILDS